MILNIYILKIEKKLSFTVGEQINEDNNKYALFEESFSIGFM